MNNVYISFIKQYTSQPLFKWILVFLSFGCLVFLCNSKDVSYFNLIYYASGNPYIIAFFLAPSSLLLCNRILSDIENNKSLVGRFLDRKKYYGFQVKMAIFITATLFLSFLLIIILCANIFASRNHLITADPNYNGVINVIGMAVSIIKLYLLLIGFEIINIAFRRIFNYVVIVVINFFVLLTFFDFLSFPSMEFIYLIFPSHYIGFKHIFDTFLENIIFSSVYLVGLLIIGVFSSRFLTINNDIKE